MQKVIFYIDGFNFYHGLKASNWRRYYWIDIVKLLEQFTRKHQELIEVNYFSAASLGKGKNVRQNLFFSANKNNSKFFLHLGKYQKKTSYLLSL